MRYHAGLNVLTLRTVDRESVKASFFTHFPCCVCASVYHTTVMCPTLHRYCLRCDERGHGKDECNYAGKRDRFERFRRFGFLTHTGQKERDAFGFKPHVPADERKKTNERFITLADTQSASALYDIE